MHPWRSILFVPATRPDRFHKALASSADIICIDLEDAVAPRDKAGARETAVAFFNGPDCQPGRCMIRINNPRLAEGADDLEAIRKTDAGPLILMLPKTESSDEIAAIREACKSKDPILVPIIESAAGLDVVEDIARMSDHGVVALAFGSADFAADIGCDTGWDALLYARGRIVAATALGRVSAIDGVWFDIHDDTGLAAETKRIAAMGFAGKLAIHPKQVPTIHAGLRPGQEEIAHAERVIDAASMMTDGVCVVDGRMVDAPVIAAARRTLDLAAADGDT